MHTNKLAIILISLIVFLGVFTFALTTPQADKSVIYYFKFLNASIIDKSTTATTVTPTPVTANTILYHEPAMSAECINKLLASKSSPAVGNGQVFVDFSKQYNIDSAFILGVFNAESSMGTAGVAVHTRSIGNETCPSSIREDSQQCYKQERIIDGEKRTFYYKISPSWKDGIEHIYKFFTSGSYYVTAGNSTIDTVAPWYVEGKANKDLTSAESGRVQDWIKNVKTIYDKYPQSC
jgi:hypothetical protein